ncbi:MAG: hypothetical protein KF819_25310 [Labilithrix sp.]|nr:hypothetical protein [Labilithrix sp.]
MRAVVRVAMFSNDGTTSRTQTSERPTRAAVVLTLAMMVAPLFTLVVSAAGCTRPAARATAFEGRAGSEGAAGFDMAPQSAGAKHTSE